ncbi:alpha-ketoglutarate dehydrogenase [Ectopseudomonas hydrolytica]|uniref:alpha-ketoglutarate dehydrogenase n=1 Tax=Ectopseudomonas hydrolytica TaxID=2493633 RepID=UPI003EE21A94
MTLHFSHGHPDLDADPVETLEWLESFQSVQMHDPKRALYLLGRMDQFAKEQGLINSSTPYSSYRNTIPLEHQGAYPGDLVLEERLVAISRWNALAMVVQANKAYGDLGGHIASYASAAEIFEVGFNHFFQAPTPEHGGDLVYFQPHSAPGVYARAYLEGRLTEEQLLHYRQEVDGNGLCSYPHPWLMPDFWQFPTGSMGIGPINSIYQARFLRYLHHRGLANTEGRHVWSIVGDGEMDEPESIAGLSLAAREGLDNLTFIINCNLQRLDGPVRGNGQIIQELEALFAGAGWNVIKVLWGSEWDALFARDQNHTLLRKLANTVDGVYQTLGSKDGAYNIENFFKKDPEIQSLVSHMSDVEIDALKRGGHDLRKLHAAYAAAKNHKGKPTVILAKTKKGYGMGSSGESRMTSHQQKKLDENALKAFRDRFQLPLNEEELAAHTFYKPKADSPEMVYLNRRREALGGAIPVRRTQAAPVNVPAVKSYAAFAVEGTGREMSTTMAMVRMMTGLIKDKELGPRLVPIVADEARTFGMANLFNQIGIYSPVGQLYAPEDAGSLMSYREAKDGQLLEEGINEAGAISSWVAAGTAYSVSGIAMLPFYIFYSMFGFQRVGDLIWAAADQRTRGFLIGATAGRTTLGGEGLQHQDGSSQLIASTIPNCRAYDPAFAGELAVIVDYGMRQMMERQVDEFYYITVCNENYLQEAIPEEKASDIVKGLYLYKEFSVSSAVASVRLLGSGPILREIEAAAETLAGEWNIHCTVFSATSFSELAREAREVERWNRRNPDQPQKTSHIQTMLDGEQLVVAATDYVRAYPNLIAPYLSGKFVVLGTDGFGRSDTRKKLREFFEIDRINVVIATLHALATEGQIPQSMATDAINRYGVDRNAPAPWTV